jgi:glycosidase
MKNPDAFLLAEVYQPHLYRDYIHLGKMDYLYDKVEFYDSLKAIMQGHGDSAVLADIQTRMADIEEHMLHFLENHDEQRIASPDFAGDAEKGKPALVVSALISRSPTMLYFGQDVGEDGSEETGFGDPTRTTIFDYAGVPAHQRWMNNGSFDGGQLSAQERALREYYINVMQISATHPAMMGEYQSLHASNIDAASAYDDKTFAFTRWTGDQQLVVVSQFTQEPKAFTLHVPAETVSAWQLASKTLNAIDLLTGQSFPVVSKDDGSLAIEVAIDVLGSLVLELNANEE